MSSRGLEQTLWENDPAFSPGIAPSLPQPPQPEEPARALFLVPSPGGSGELEASSETNWPLPAARLDARKCTLLLELERDGLIERLIEEPDLSELTSYGFQPKGELHITVLSYGNGMRILRAMDRLPEPGRNEATARLGEAISDTDWSWQPTGTFYPFQGRRRGSLKLVTMIDCPGVEGFYDRVESLFSGLELEQHPMHITLMKKPGEVNGHAGALIGGIALGDPLRTLDHLVPSRENEHPVD